MIEQVAEDVDAHPSISYRLNDLLERMAAETFPDVVEFGPVIGEEVW